MARAIRYDDIEGIIDDYVLIDTRSPSEYIEGTIPGAVSIPLFSDSERETMGTLYKKEDPELAKKIGIELVSKKLPAIYDKVVFLSTKYKHLVFFCDRGGMRSNSITSFFEAIGINAIILEGGYKAYRDHVLDNLPKLVDNVRFIVLYGKTGTGKTRLLKKLKEKDMSVVDLEQCANHRGSTLDSLGGGNSNSQKTFESLIYDALINKSSNLVFIEGESKRIDKDIIPKYLFDAMENGIHIEIVASMEKRIENILNDYVNDTDKQLLEVISHMKSQLGQKKTNRFKELIESHDYEFVIRELIDDYLDPLYKGDKRDYTKVINNDDMDKALEDLIMYKNEY